MKNFPAIFLFRIKRLPFSFRSNKNPFSKGQKAKDFMSFIFESVISVENSNLPSLCSSILSCVNLVYGKLLCDVQNV